MKPVSDPAVLQQLEGVRKPVTDPRLLAQLEPGPNPTEGNSFLTNFAAGYGKALPDVALGARQIVGRASQADVDERRRLDAPLMETWGGKLGNIAGGVAPVPWTVLRLASSGLWGCDCVAVNE